MRSQNGGRKMKKSLSLALCTLILVWVSTSSGQDSAMIEAAKREGKVAWYTSLAIPSSTALAHLFMNKYKGLLMKYIPKGVEGFPEGFKDKEGFYYGMRATLSVIAHNPKVVTEKEAPESWKELLDPKWRGKMVTAHPGYSGIIMTHVLALVNLYGWDYFKELANNKLHVLQSANDPAGVVASGERPIGVNGAEHFYYKTLQQGNPIKIVYPKEGVPLIVSPTAIAKDAPHPNASKLFTDFIFTKEAQQMLADKEGLYTGHPGVTYPKDKPQLKDLKLLAADPAELEKKNAEIKKTIVEFFGA